MFKLLSTIVSAIVLVSDIASSESPSKLIQRWSKMDLPFYGSLIHPVIPVTSLYHTIKVVGKLRDKDKFHIALISGNNWKTEDVPLHFTIDTAREQFVTSQLNWTSGTERTWGPATYSPCSLKADDSFDIEIIVKHTHAYITVNGQIIQRHLHPLSPSAISYVHVYCEDGDFVNLHSVSREYPIYEPSLL